MKSHILKSMKIKNKFMGNLYDHGLPIFGNESSLQ
jgi:hypothetical protein